MRVARAARAARAIGLAMSFVGVLALSSCDGWRPFGCKQEPPDPNVIVPDSFVVHFTTSHGAFDVIARKQWAPIGVARFYALVGEKHFDEARFFRVIRGFVAQFGLSGDPKVNDAWRRRCMADEPVRHQNERGTLTFARSGSGTRSTQLFINLADNTPLDTLDGLGFPPIAQVTSGLSVVDSLYADYGDSPRHGVPQYGHEGPTQDSIVHFGNAYLEHGWPKLDYITTARVVQEWPAR